jgi:hypothetical protein
MTPGDGIVAGRFPLGQLLITRAAAGRLAGDLSAEDAAENELSLREGFRLLSAYGQGDRRFWIITEADRSVTTVLLAEDY